jgi:hypothetical protein
MAWRPPESLFHAIVMCRSCPRTPVGYVSGLYNKPGHDGVECGQRRLRQGADIQHASDEVEQGLTSPRHLYHLDEPGFRAFAVACSVVFGGRTAAFLWGQEAMRRGPFILAVFILMAVTGQDAHAAKFGTKSSYQHLQDLTGKGPKGEALALGYETATHSFFLPYKMTGGYVLLVRGSGRDLFAGRDIYHALSQKKIAQMQRAGALPNPLPPARHTIFDYLGAYVLWWFIPMTFGFIGIFSKLGIGSRPRDERRSA